MRRLSIKPLCYLFLLPFLVGCQNNNISLSDSPSLPPSVAIKFHVSFYNENGTTPLQVVEVVEGENAIYTGITPNKESDEDYNYTWNGWDHELENVREDFSTYATYSKKIIETEGLIYELNEDEESYAVTDYIGDTVDIIVPRLHNDLPVTIIGEKAFMYEDNDENRNCKYIETIKIPSGVTTLKKSCFAQLEFLKSINLPQSITVMEENIFHGPNRFLENIVLPDNIKRIEQYTFTYCFALKTIHLPDNLEYLGKIVFAQCSKLESIDIPDKVYAIGYGCFNNCFSLTSINIPANVYTIAPTNVSMPGSYKNGVGPFKGCSKLKEITVDSNNKLFYSKDGVLYYKDNDIVILYAYPSAKEETSFIITKDVTTIRDSAFYGATHLTKIDAEEDSKLKKIEIESFSSCINLNYIYIPKTVLSIKINAFLGCSIASFLCEIDAKPDGWEDGYIPSSIVPTWNATRE